MEPDPNPRDDADDTQVDDLLRKALEPRSGVAERIARAALNESRSSNGLLSLRPALTAFALLVVVGAIWLAPPGSPPAGPDAIGVDERADLAAPPADPARLSITNRGGTVTVTTADGTRWLAIAPAAPNPGDPSS